MIKLEDVYKIGCVGKPHGLKGEVVLRLDDGTLEQADSDCLILDVDGILVPFFIDEIRFRGSGSALVKFCDVETVDAAAALTGCNAYLHVDAVDLDGGEMPKSALEGFALLDAVSGRMVGRIASVNDATANVLFVMDDGTLVPASAELVENLDVAKREIRLRLPDGLLDL